MSTPFSQDWFTRIANQNNNKSKCPYLKEAIIKVVNMLKESNLRRDCGGGMNTITKIELTQEWETIVMHNLKAVEVSLSLLLGIFF
ncbi:MAG: hypothetical protein LBD75_07595 [Candidatus Peribacteria bacterium]|jgi:hypothetical protein|nr:hypothetical protein [Candidatus Peribacteria bacterium]